MFATPCFLRAATGIVFPPLQRPRAWVGILLLVESPPVICLRAAIGSNAVFSLEPNHKATLFGNHCCPPVQERVVCHPARRCGRLRLFVIVDGGATALVCRRNAKRGKGNPWQLETLGTATDAGYGWIWSDLAVRRSGMLRQDAGMRCD